MKKINLFFPLSILLLLGVFLTGCQKTASTGYYDVIPGDAGGVISVKLEQLIEKADAGDKLQSQLLTILQGQISPELLEKIGQIVKNGNESGLDLKENLYLFFVPEGNKGGMVAKVADMPKLKETFDLLQKEGQCTPLSETNGYQKTTLGGEVVCMFNQTTLLCVITNDALASESYAAQLIAQPADQRMISKEGFQKVSTSKEDINFFVALGMLPKEIEQQSFSMLPEGVDISKLNILGALNFENGKASLYYEYTADPATLEKIAAHNDYFRKVTNRFLGAFPVATLYYMETNFDGKKFNDVLSASKIFEQLSVQEDNKAEIEKVLSAFDGEISLGIPNLFPMGIPAVLGFTEVKDAYPAQALANLIKTQFGEAVQLQDNGNNTYELNIFMINMKVYFGVKDGVMYLTNDQEMYKNFDGKLKESLDNSPIAASLKRSYGGLILNIESAMQSPMVQMGLGQMGEDGKLLQQILSQFTYAETLGESKTKAVCNVYLKDKKQNSLKVFVRLAEQITAQQ